MASPKNWEAAVLDFPVSPTCEKSVLRGGDSSGGITGRRYELQLLSKGEPMLGTCQHDEPTSFGTRGNKVVGALSALL